MTTTEIVETVTETVVTETVTETEVAMEYAGEAMVEACARAAHEVNRAYCLALGDTSHVPWEEAPEWQKTSARNGVKALLDDPSMTPEQSHEGWTIEKLRDGWKYGPEKRPDLKEHPCLVLYNELPIAQRAKDSIFRQVVLEVARAVG